MRIDGEQLHLDAALGGEHRRVDVGHLLVDDAGEHALERRQLEHRDVRVGDLAAHLDCRGPRERRRPGR